MGKGPKNKHTKHYQSLTEVRAKSRNGLDREQHGHPLDGMPRQAGEGRGVPRMGPGRDVGCPGWAWGGMSGAWDGPREGCGAPRTGSGRDVGCPGRAWGGMWCAQDRLREGCGVLAQEGMWGAEDGLREGYGVPRAGSGRDVGCLGWLREGCGVPRRGSGRDVWYTGWAGGRMCKLRPGE